MGGAQGVRKVKFRLTNKFSKSEQGGMSVDAMFALPILIWAITATFVFFDAFKTLNVGQKATYTVADMLSREEEPIDADYLTTMREMFTYLSNGTRNHAIRVTVVHMAEDADTGEKFRQMIWSEGTGGIDGHDDLETIESRLPDMAVGDQMIVVESTQQWSPAFAVGLASYNFHEFAISRPRFAPQLCWEGTYSSCS